MPCTTLFSGNVAVRMIAMAIAVVGVAVVADRHHFTSTLHNIS